MSPSGSHLVRGDQGAAGSLGAPLPRVLLGQGSAQHAPGPSFYWDAPSRSGTLCNAACDPLGQSRSTTDHTPRAPLWGSAVGGRKLQVTRPTDSLSSLVVGHPCPAAGARSTGHTQPPTRANHDPQENDKRCAPALKAPSPPSPKDPPRHARLHIQARRYLPLASALTRYGDCQQSGQL